MSESDVKKCKTVVVEEINITKMLDFYRDFNSINFKYGLDLNQSDYNNQYRKLEEYESMFQFADMTKMEYGDILSNLDMIYAGSENSDKIVYIFDIVRNKIINQYIGIDGLERLFSEKYVDFEWDMHLGIDYKKHKMKYYRDHFVHQIRNAYCMHILLEKFGWLKKVQEVLSDPSYSKISVYIQKFIEQQLQLRKVVLGKTLNKDFYYKNLIYMSSYMAALFHDIGYPESANTVNQKRITEYIANLYNAESSGYNYNRINALLQNSLLFRVVSFEEIKKRLEKPDHGALSAIIFLFNFYENGAIHGLEPYKRCAVELAALAIYNHTNEYSWGKVGEKCEYAKNLFVLNPIAYLLRICDDLQEWDRIYFELSNKSNMIICSSCHTPIVRKRNEKQKTYYDCNCRYTSTDNEIALKGIFSPVFEYDRNFPYRRIYNVVVCEGLRIAEEKEILTFSLNYCLDKLLHIAYINPDYAKYRVKELNQFKKMLDCQQILPKMKMEYFITANPILIKTKILDEYLKKSDLAEFFEEKVDQVKIMLQNKNQDFTKEISEIITVFTKEIFEKLISPCVEKYFSDAGFEVIKESINSSFSLYGILLFFMNLHKKWNQARLKFSENMIQIEQAFKEEIIKTQRAFYTKKDLSGCDDLEGLIDDCMLQFQSMYEDIRQVASNPANYYKQFESSAYTYGCIKRFVACERYIPICEGKKGRIDAFTDLVIIRDLLENVE